MSNNQEIRTISNERGKIICEAMAKVKAGLKDSYPPKHTVTFSKINYEMLEYHMSTALKRIKESRAVKEEMKSYFVSDAISELESAKEILIKGVPNYELQKL